MGRESWQCFCFVASAALVLGGVVGVFMLMDYLGEIGVPVGIMVLVLLTIGSAVLMLCMAANRKKDSTFTQVSTPTEVSAPVMVPVTILQIAPKKEEAVEVV